MRNGINNYYGMNNNLYFLFFSNLVDGKLWSSFSKRLLRLEGFGPPQIRRARVEESRVPVSYQRNTGS